MIMPGRGRPELLRWPLSTSASSPMHSASAPAHLRKSNLRVRGGQRANRKLTYEKPAYTMACLLVIPFRSELYREWHVPSSPLLQSDYDRRVGEDVFFIKHRTVNQASSIRPHF